MAKKKATKKKAAGKQSPRKKAAKKAPARRKKAGRKKPAEAAPQPGSPDNPVVQSEVWEVYTRVRSIRAVSRETGYARDTVRTVVLRQTDKLARLSREWFEDYAAKLEQSGDAAVTLVNRTLGLSSAFIHEIEQAAAEGRHTNIRDKDGSPLPVIDAMEFLKNSGFLRDAMRVAETAWRLAQPFRLVQQQDPAGESGSAATGQPDIDNMSDVEIAELLRAAGFTLPPVLAEAVKRVEEREAKAKKAAGE